MMRVLYIFLLIFILSDASAFKKRESVIHIDEELTPSRPWMKGRDQDDRKVLRLIRLLKKSPTGEKIIMAAKSRANKKGLTLLDVIKPGEGSLTDTTLIRKFTPSNPDNIIYESRSVVYVNRHHNFKDALLDLAHELTHFTYREDFNPYHRFFTLDEFIKATVEGKGGEVEAYLVECHVEKELFSKEVRENSNCQRIRNKSNGKLSRLQAIIQFYRVGKSKRHFQNLLNQKGVSHKNLPHLSKREAHFISSAYGQPYPIAAYKEYTSIMEKVCENDAKRLALMKRKWGRTPASKWPSSYRDLRHSYKKRCVR